MTDENRIDSGLLTDALKLADDIREQGEVFQKHTTRLFETTAQVRTAAGGNDRQRLLDQLEDVDTWLLLLSVQRCHVEALRDRLWALTGIEEECTQ